MIKSFTDLEQSKKLAEILPLESADMYWWSSGKRYYIEAMDDGDFNEEEGHVHAWSLAALLGVLPNKIVSYETAFEEENAKDISDTYYKHIESTEDDRYICYYVGNGYKYKCVADNLVDACVEMIEKLHELNLL